MNNQLISKNVFYINMIGGDMLIGGLLDLGVEISELNEALLLLPIKGLKLRKQEVIRGPIKAILAEPIIDQKLADMHFSWSDFFDLINNSELNTYTKERCRRVFQRLVESEEKIHGEVNNPHELGNIDTLIDIVSVIIGFNILGAKNIYASPFPFDVGIIKTKHGFIPSFAPATSEIVASENAPVIQVDIGYRLGEMVTPTGAALVVELCEFCSLDMKITKIGYGAGQKDLKDFSNVVSMWKGESQEINNDLTDKVLLIETNIDDISGEIFGFTMEKLLNLGAIDVWATSIFMKKNRPAYKISVLSNPSELSRCIELLMEETSTLGVRVSEVKRYKSERKLIQLKTKYGLVTVKVRFNSKGKDYFPEYEECRKVALQENVPLIKVFKAVEHEISKLA